MPGTSLSGGRNAKTQTQHRLAGSWRRDRHAGRPSPEPPAGAPDPPGDLSGEALAEWHRMISRLTVSRTLSAVDDAVLARYCLLHARASRLETALADEPVFSVTTAHGERKMHPAFAQLRAYDQALRQFLAELGLTPASRGRVSCVDSEQRPDDGGWDALTRMTP